MESGADALRTWVVAIVEDDEFMARSLARCARVAGFEPAILVTCAEALARFTDPSAADAILLDLELPDGWGLDLLAELRRRKVRAPVLIVSAHCTLELIDRAYSLQAMYLKKPGMGPEVMQFLVAQKQAAFGPTPEQILAFANRYGLTDRHTEVLAVACVDRHHPTMAVVLGIRPDTLARHIQAILIRCGADDLHQVIEWVRAQSVPPPRAGGRSECVGGRNAARACANQLA